MADEVEAEAEVEDPIPAIIKKFDLGWCGCGRPEDALQFVRSVLSALAARLDADWSQETVEAVDGLLPLEMHPGAAGEGAGWFVLYELDAAGLLEHGGSVGGSWLTEKGRELLDALDALEEVARG